MTLDKIIVPLSEYKQLGIYLYRLLRNGYVNRNPLKPEYVIKLNSIADILFEKNNYNKYNDYKKIYSYEIQANSCLAIIGLSGTGKSTAVKSIISSFPKLIQHKSYNGVKYTGTQVVILYINCPVKGSLNGLCLNFFAALDDVLGTNYFEEQTSRRASVDAMKIKMIHYSYLYNVGMLIIDEVDHLKDSKTGPDSVLSFLVTLNNTIGIPIVFVGTYEALDFMQMNYSIGRRVSSGGEIYFNNLSKNVEWESFLKHLWKYQYTQNKCNLTDEISNIMYQETQGIIQYAVKLYKTIQDRAIISGKEIITPQLIKEVAKREIKITKPMIDAIKNEDYKCYEQYFGRLPGNANIYEYKKKDKKYLKTKSIKNEEKNINIDKLNFDKIVLYLLTKGCNIDISEKVTKKVMMELGTTDNIDDLITEAYKQALQFKVDKESK